MVYFWCLRCLVCGPCLQKPQKACLLCLGACVPAGWRPSSVSALLSALQSGCVGAWSPQKCTAVRLLGLHSMLTWTYTAVSSWLMGNSNVLLKMCIPQILKGMDFFICSFSIWITSIYCLMTTFPIFLLWFLLVLFLRVWSTFSCWSDSVSSIPTVGRGFKYQECLLGLTGCLFIVWGSGDIYLTYWCKTPVVVRTLKSRAA